jgi:hypothetical protein
MEQPKVDPKNGRLYTHRTPSGVLVYIVQPARDGWWLMSCGSIIPPEILKKWEIAK